MAAIRHLLDTDTVRGPVNLTSPAPVTNLEFTKALGEVLGRPTVLPVPKLALTTMFGKEMVAEMLYAGQRVLPAVLQASGFTFRDDGDRGRPPPHPGQVAADQRRQGPVSTSSDRGRSRTAPSSPLVRA